MNLPILLAPIQGVTNSTFRRVFAASFPGLSAAVAPFIPTATGQPPPAPLLKEIDPAENPPGLSLIPQILGNDGGDFLATAEIIQGRFGHHSFNWNIGCPVGTVSARQRGAGLLSHPDLIDGFLETVFKNPPGPVSLKMRLGMHSPREWQALVPVLNRYPLDFCVVHARTGDQGYRGHADVDMFGELFALLRVPLYYNGDLTAVAQCLAVARRFPGLAGLMIGRGLVANPLLPSEIKTEKESAPAEIQRTFWALHDGLADVYGATREPGAAVERLKELLGHGAPALMASLPVRTAAGQDARRHAERALRQVLKTRRLPDYHQDLSALRAALKS